VTGKLYTLPKVSDLYKEIDALRMELLAKDREIDGYIRAIKLLRNELVKLDEQVHRAYTEAPPERGLESSGSGKVAGAVSEKDRPLRDNRHGGRPKRKAPRRTEH